jgi:hypothetical protein
MKYHSVAAVQPLRSFAKQFGLGFHPETEAFAAIPILEEASEWAVPVKKVASHKRFSVRFSFPGGPLSICRGVHADISRRRGEAVSYAHSRERLEVASMDEGGPKIPGVVHKGGSRTIEPGREPVAICLLHFLFLRPLWR